MTEGVVTAASGVESLLYLRGTGRSRKNISKLLMCLLTIKLSACRWSMVGVNIDARKDWKFGVCGRLQTSGVNERRHGGLE